LLMRMPRKCSRGLLGAIVVLSALCLAAAYAACDRSAKGVNRSRVRLRCDCDYLTRLELRFLDRCGDGLGLSAGPVADCDRDRSLLA
jgi:hypothetical protein